MGICGSPRIFCDLCEGGMACGENREPFFSSLQSEQIKKRIYPTRAEAKSEIFDHIAVVYNGVRRPKHLDQLSPHEFERQRQIAL